MLWKKYCGLKDKRLGYHPIWHVSRVTAYCFCGFYVLSSYLLKLLEISSYVYILTETLVLMVETLVKTLPMNNCWTNLLNDSIIRQTDCWCIATEVYFWCRQLVILKSPDKLVLKCIICCDRIHYQCGTNINKVPTIKPVVLLKVVKQKRKL